MPPPLPLQVRFGNLRRLPENYQGERHTEIARCLPDRNGQKWVEFTEMPGPRRACRRRTPGFLDASMWFSLHRIQRSHDGERQGSTSDRAFGVPKTQRVGQRLMGPGQLGRNLQKVSPPHLLFQRSHSRPDRACKLRPVCFVCGMASSPTGPRLCG
jgi:hypothetical protein